jgi:hypothetical protein
MPNWYMKAVRQRRGNEQASAAIEQGGSRAGDGDKLLPLLPATSAQAAPVPCWCGTQECRSGWPADAPPPAELPNPLRWLDEHGYRTR